MADEGHEATPQEPMEHEAAAADAAPTEDSEIGGAKRAREGDDGPHENGVKKAKTEGGDDGPDENGEKKAKTEGEIEEESGRATVGPKTFGSAVEIFDYFYKLLHTWPTNLDLNKYEHLMLLELLKKGHLEADKKIGSGVKAFQVRFHPQYKSRCFFLTREDESSDDFSFRKCVDHILPLPENMQIKHDVNKALRGKGGGRGRGRGRGGGR